MENAYCECSERCLVCKCGDVVIPKLEIANPRRVLLLERDTLQLSEYKNMLKKLGYSVEGVSDTGDALDAFVDKTVEGAPYDVLLADTQARGIHFTGDNMGGSEAALRAKHFYPSSRVVVMGLEADFEFKEFGFDAYLKKPFSLGSLREVLEKLFEE